MFLEKDINNKKILLALDLNEIPTRSSFRIQSSLLSIQKLLDFKPKQLVLLSHFGRPKGIDPDYSLEEHVRVLSGLIGRNVQFISGTEENGFDEIGEDTGVFLYENLRFFDWNKLEIANKLSKSFDFMVYDSFGLVHRDKPYTTELVQAFEKNRVSTGLLMDKEIQMLDKYLKNKSPKILILGGKKIGDKLPLLDVLINKVEKVLIVGAIANVFYKSLGIEIGNSYVNLEGIGGNNISWSKIKEYNNSGKINLPRKVILKDQTKVDLFNNKNNISENANIVDIDPESYKEINFSNHALFWNGNAGITEDGFEDGTLEIAKKIIKSKFSVAAGGDTAKWLQGNLELAKEFNHISTGGGAALEYIVKSGDLPIFKVLK